MKPLMAPYEPENMHGMYPKRKLIVALNVGLKQKTLDKSTPFRHNTYID
jgi:hypothetical protein